MLGSALARQLKKNNTVFGCDIASEPVFNDIKTDCLDLRDRDAVGRIMKYRDFDVLIHTAAMINVDGCEERPDLAKELNSDVTEHLAEICREKNALMVYISTDAVFDGEKEGQYTEEDEVNPINVYGETKLMGERAVSSLLEKYLILRTNIYGWNLQDKMSFAEWVLNSLEDGKEMTMFRDVMYTPVYTGNFALVLEELLEKNITGLYHLTGDEVCSKLDFGLALARVFSKDNSGISSISVEEFHFKAPRSKNMSLDNGRIKKLLSTPLMNVEEGLKEFFKTRPVKERVS